MTAIDQRAAESARRVHDPLARAAIIADLQRMASYTAGVLAGLMDSAVGRDHVDAGLITDLCRADDLLTDIAGQIEQGDVFASGLRVAA